MNKSILSYAVAALYALLCGACNSDIFVEPIPDMVDSLTLPGFNGSKTFKLHRKGLLRISFDNNYTWQTSSLFYDCDGNEIIPTSDIDEIDKIVYSSNMFAVELHLKGEEAEIVVIDNAYSDGMEMMLILDYGHTVKTVTLNIGGGRPHVMTQFGYFINNPATGCTTEKGLHQNMINNSGQTIRMEIHPYQEAKSRLRLTPDDEYYWSYGSIGNAQIAGYVNGEWSLSAPSEIEAAIGKTTFFNSPYVNADEKAYVDIPAYSAVGVDVTISYATFDSGYTAIVNLPNFERSWMVFGKYELMQPIGYTIETTPLEL